MMIIVFFYFPFLNQEIKGNNYHHFLQLTVTCMVCTATCYSCHDVWSLALLAEICNWKEKTNAEERNKQQMQREAPATELRFRAFPARDGSDDSGEIRGQDQ